MVQLVIFSVSFFFLSLLGITMHKKSVIKVLMFIELMLVSCSVLFLILYADAPFFAPEGLLFPLIILTVAAAESALGLAILILLYKKYHTTLISQLAVLRG